MNYRGKHESLINKIQQQSSRIFEKATWEERLSFVASLVDYKTVPDDNERQYIKGALIWSANNHKKKHLSDGDREYTLWWIYCFIE